MRLDDVRVLDLTRLLPGPYATQLLADMGADVVKVEDTGAGDYARHTPPVTDRGTGALFDSVNRGKRSVAIDLKSDEGREAFMSLAAEADVVFEQFRPGVVDRLGVDYESVREVNDDVVYCSLSGYGATGPYRERAGHDLNYVGVAGLLDMTRNDEDDAPRVPGYQIGDLGGGLFAAFSIVSALLSRELGNTGGEFIDVSMTDVVASFSQSIAYEALAGDAPRPGETALTGLYPWYDVYECAEGRYLTLGALEPEFWQAFCEEVGKDEWIGEHMTGDPDRRAALRAGLEELFAERSRDEWLADLSDQTMTAPVLSPAEAFEHDQLAERVVKRPDDAPPRVGFPAAGTDAPTDTDESVPGHGEHTDAVLREVGLDEAEIEALRDDGAVN
jgi:crotonobetainyl-CoA:carnitine CoA-transferase CaiB-like acyl-CoA transferase